MNKKPKVFVGVSGGVDSSVALALLQSGGYDVTGVFLKVWSPDFLPCDWKEERRSAMRVCATLGVPFLTIDCVDEYKKEVVDYMIREYKSGRVPNPDVFCNKYVKFGVFLRKALEMGADYVATGHYAQVGGTVGNSPSRIFGASQPDSARENSLPHESETYFSSGLASLLRGPEKNKSLTQGGCLLRESIDKEKDQSYFLYTLTQKELKHTLFPIGHLTKPEVRKLARKFGLPTAEKKDSQGLCFIGKVDMKDFLSHFIETKKGEVLNTRGEVVGEHDGSIFYTIGQRHGFTVTKKSSEEPRLFVISKDLDKNTVTVADKESEQEKIFSTKELVLTEVTFTSEVPEMPREIWVRIRYRQEKQKCTLDKKGENYHVKFDRLQNAIAVGQSAVFYDKDVCLGGGIIEKVMQ